MHGGQAPGDREGARHCGPAREIEIVIDVMQMFDHQFRCALAVLFGQSRNDVAMVVHPAGGDAAFSVERDDERGPRDKLRQEARENLIARDVGDLEMQAA